MDSGLVDAGLSYEKDTGRILILSEGGEVVAVFFSPTDARIAEILAVPLECPTATLWRGSWATGGQAQKVGTCERGFKLIPTEEKTTAYGEGE